jgi:hypothetical protein
MKKGIVALLVGLPTSAVADDHFSRPYLGV